MTKEVEEARKLLDKATKFKLTLKGFLEIHKESGQTIPELNLDGCKELALVTKFSLDQICEAFNVEPPPEGWHY